MGAINELGHSCNRASNSSGGYTEKCKSFLLLRRRVQLKKLLFGLVIVMAMIFL